MPQVLVPIGAALGSKAVGGAAAAATGIGALGGGPKQAPKLLTAPQTQTQLPTPGNLASPIQPVNLQQPNLQFLGSNVQRPQMSLFDILNQFTNQGGK